jgi:large subunit ribosomal protein L23
MEVRPMSKDPRDIIIKPVVSEKSYAGYDLNVYTFIVAQNANKIEIRTAVEQLFARKVEKVHTINRKAKRTRNRNTGAYNAPARQKRAIVTLAAGEERIDIFGS